MSAEPEPTLRPLIAVEGSDLAQRRMTDLQEAVSRSQWGRAVELVEGLRDADPLNLEVRRGTFRNVTREIDRIVPHFPEVLTRLRKRMTTADTRWREISQRPIISDADERGCEEFLARFWLSPHAPEASWKLAESAWRRGDWETARRHLLPLIRSKEADSKEQKDQDDWRFPEVAAELQTRAATLLARIETSPRDRGISPGPFFGGVAWTSHLSTSEWPVVAKEHVVFSSSRSIRVVNLADGQAAWPAEIPDDDGTIVSLNDDGKSLKANESSLFSPVIANGRLLAGLRDGEDVRRSERLVCCELRGAEGRVVWTQLLNEVSGLGDHRIVSDPLAIPGGWCFGVERQVPPHRLSVLCIRDTSGEREWICDLGTRVPGTPSSANLYSPAQVGLRYAAGRIYVDSGAEAAACLDRAGRMLWITVCPPHPTLATTEKYQARSSPVFHSGRVTIISSDNRGLRCFSAETGELLWDRRLPVGVISVIVGEDGNLIASGKMLWGIEAKTGRILWSTGFAENGLGSPAVLVGSSVLWASGDELWQVESRDGRLQNRMPLKRWEMSTVRQIQVSADHLLLTNSATTAVRFQCR